MKLKRFSIVLVGLLVAVSLWLPRETQAINVWGDWFDRTVGQKGFNDVGFGRKDPRTIAANVVNIALGLLGVLAIILIMYAGFVWMMAGGNPERVDIAKKILISASIGLLIILSAWALSIYILSRLWLATGSQGGEGEGLPCTPDGLTVACGCGGQRTCVGNEWSACIGSDCGGGSIGREPCDSNSLTPECDADNAVCAPGGYCNLTDCFCSKLGGYGDTCNKDSSGQTCEADAGLCQPDLTCDDTKCLCLGEPVIEAISPVGGFCDGSVDAPCLSDADCSAFNPQTCNQTSPNGAPGNLVTITGRYFLPYQAGVSQVRFWDGSAFSLEAPLAVTVNQACSESWTDNQIVVVVPAGAKEGGLEVVAANGSDSTDNNRGPALNNFIPNNLKRPGLCNLNPIFGRLDSLLTYSGLGLNGATAFFGSATQNLQAGNSKFTAEDSGTAQVPNLRSGQTTTFVAVGNGPVSNFLKFTQETENAKAPVIIGFDPVTGSAGQYVTIRGSGFGNGRRDSQVFFGETEANYDFPQVCAKSVWRDSEIIVKVPAAVKNGDYKIMVEVGNLQAESTDTFKIDDKVKLLPGLCKLDPLFGQVNDEISLWGEYFDPPSKDSRVSFYQNVLRTVGPKLCLGGAKDGQACNLPSDCDSQQCLEEILYWGRDRTSKDNNPPDVVTTKVPAQTITGPVKIGKANPTLFGNGINFTIGQCSQDSQCGDTNVCCPATTPAAGRCQPSLAECYGSIDSCVYEWEFNTGSKNNCPPSKPNKCSDGSCCRSECVLDTSTGLTTCLDNASCASFGGRLCLDSLLCPNSPGNCSFNAQAQVTGASCDCSFLSCPDCQYDSDLNRCVSPQTCSLQEKVNIDGKEWSRYCTKYNGTARWHIETKQTCPKGFTPTAIGSKTCVDLSSNCELCPEGKVCFGGSNNGQVCANNSDCPGGACRAQTLVCANVGGLGKCTAPWPTCPSNFTCQNDVCTRKEGTCECCCDKRQNQPDKTNPACCAPLTCENECGAGGDFGYCSGCANVGLTQDEHDAACNCEGHNGKYCDTTLPGGACRDCSQIGDVSFCGEHAACCVDSKQGNACRGLTDSKFLDPETNINFCAYFNCADNCQTASTTGAFDVLAKCQNDCAINCDNSPKTPGCQANSNNCPKDKPICNEDCLCEDDNLGAEKICSTPAGACTLLCDQPFGCRGEAGCQGADCAGQPDEDTCRCCCNPFNKSDDPTAPDFDKCKALGDTGKLFCQENVGDCSGNARGLCCGCKADEDCGDAAAVGCGADTCCHNRPEVNSMIPEPDSQSVCRNALIRVKFNEIMDKNSFPGNIIVVGDYGDDLCPGGSTLLAGLNQPVDQGNFLVKWWRQLKSLLSKVLPWLPTPEASAAGNHNFCAFIGKAVGSSSADNQDSGLNQADFLLSQALSANIKYYAIVKGDDGLNNHSGVLDINKIGLRGTNQSDTDSFNGIIYPNAQIWSFTTGPDICLLDKVVVNPNQYLFQKPRDSHDFYADAQARNGNIITPLPIYGWAWDWRSDNSSVASVTGEVAPEDYQATVTSGSKRDAETYVYARATIVDDEINPISTKDKYKEGRARIIVFICENPWPAVTDPTAWPVRWVDKPDNCTVNNQGIDCLDNHFEFYYCRDKAGKGTKDDLPSLTLEPPIRGKYKYQSSGLWVDVLKDFYFFRINLPNNPSTPIVELTAAKQGGEVKVSWTTERDMTYKVYYGTTSGVYSDYREAGANDSIIISGLKNNQDYYFALTATNLQKAESAYSDEVKLKVEDKIAPNQPENVRAQAFKTANDRKITASWSKDTTEAVRYLFEYGPTQSPAVSVNVGSVLTHTVGKLNNLDVQDYYLKIIALDAYNNKSDPVQFLCAKGCDSATGCDCQLQ